MIYILDKDVMLQSKLNKQNDLYFQKHEDGYQN